MRRWGGHIEENAGGGCQIRHQLRRYRAREAVASTTRVHTSNTVFARRDVLTIREKYTRSRTGSTRGIYIYINIGFVKILRLSQILNLRD